MNGLARRFVHMGLFVVGFLAVGAVIGGGVWYLWSSYEQPVGERPEISIASIERSILGMYLQTRQADVQTPINPDNDSVRPFSIEPGEAARTVAANLESAGLITDAGLFSLLVRYLGIDQGLEAGDYFLRPNMTMEEIALELRQGRMSSVPITIPEGWRAEQIGQALAEIGVVKYDEFMDIVTRGGYNYAFLRDRPSGTPSSLEGYLFPDTYQMPRYVDASTIVDVLLGNFDTRVTADLRSAIASQGRTLYEVLILASIVEREAVLAEERPIIASVYLNRIEKGMYLQADPTVQYAKGYEEDSGRWWADLLVEEYSTVKSPYNTYLNPGLPPGPICNPGLNAIEAVVNPMDTEYLFFLARGDGSHVFAVTYEEHLQNQETYRGQ